jgi:hypothetical protein
MEGVTTAIVAFIFVCLIYPHLIKHKPQFYAALGLVLVIILLDAIGHMVAPTSPTSGEALYRVTYVFAALMQMLAILLLVLCVGGLTVSDLAGEVSNTVEVMRWGEDKPVLVPLRGETPKPRAETAPAAAAPPRKAVQPDRDASIPLE